MNKRNFLKHYNLIKRPLIIIGFLTISIIGYIYKTDVSLDYSKKGQPIVKNSAVSQLKTVPGKPIKWIKTVKVSEINSTQHFVEIPKNASNIKISISSSSSIQNKIQTNKDSFKFTKDDLKKLSELSTQISKSEASLVLAESIKNKKLNFFARVSNSFSRISYSMLATVEDAVGLGEGVFSDLTGSQQVDTVLIDVAPLINSSSIDLEQTISESIEVDSMGSSQATSIEDQNIQTPEDSSILNQIQNLDSRLRGNDSERNITPSEQINETRVQQEIVTSTDLITATPVVEPQDSRFTTGQATSEESTTSVIASESEATQVSSSTDLITATSSNQEQNLDSLFSSTTLGINQVNDNNALTSEITASSTASSTDLISVEYETPAPVIAEAETETGKIVTISAEDTSDAPVTDVLAFTNIPEIYKVGQEDKIKIKWSNNDDQNVEFHAYDLNGNGKLDYVEWTVPHLSTQTFEIIFISKAFQLDADKNIFADIYDQVATKDNIWAPIEDMQYVRVTFYKQLNETNDITIYARPTGSSTSVKIEVYPVYIDQEGNQNEGPKLELVSDGTNPTFDNIDHNDKYRILLSNLQAPTDVFDLKIIGNIDFDYIVDPTSLLTGIVSYYKFDESSGNASDATGHGYTATNNSTVTYSSTTPTKINNHAVFSGSNYFSTASQAVGSGVSTVSVWVRVAALPSVLYGLVGGPQNYPSYTMTPTGFAVGKSLVGNNSNIAFSVSLNTWYMVTFVTNSGSSTDIYVNGIYRGTSSGSFVATLGNHIYNFGTGGNISDVPLTGRLDEIGIWSRELSQSEITTLYNNGNGFQYPFSSVPDAPTIGTATAGNGQATITFTPPANDGGATIDYYIASSSPGGINIATTSTSSVVVTGLTNGTAYTFTIYAHNSIGTSTASASSNSVTPNPPTVPNAPTIGTATAGNGQATITFTPPANNGGATIDYYTASSSPGGINIATTSTSSVVVTGLTNGVAYTFTIYAHNSIGTSTASASSNSVTPFPLSTGIVSYYKFDESSGNASDASGNGYTATNNSTVTYSSTTPTKINNHAVFSGSNHFSTASQAVGSGKFTMNTWVRVAALPSNLYALFGGPQNYPDLTMTHTGFSTGKVLVAAGSNVPYSVSINTWYMVTGIVQNSTTMSIYVNGSFIGTSTVTSCTLGNHSFKFGTGGNISDVPLTGRLDEIGIWSRELSQSEITTLYNNGNGLQYPFLIISDAPTIGTATAGNAQATVTYTAPGNNGGATIIDYTITSSPGSISTTTTSTTTAVVTGLSNGTAYTFTVTARNSVGSSASSSATSPAVTPVGALPIASSVNIDSAAASVILSEGSTKNVVCTGTVTDTDGYAYITSVTAKLYRSGVGAGAGNNNENHYTLTGDSQCIPSGGSGNTETYTCTFPVYFYADATDAGSTYEVQNWVCQMTPSSASGEGSADTDTIEMSTLKALSVSPTINYGSLTPGQNSTGDHTVTVTNTGNSSTGFKVSGNNLSCSVRSFVPVDNQRYSSSSFSYNSGAVLSGSTVDMGVSLNKPTQSTSTITQNIYWQVSVPAGTKGTCSGATSFVIN